MNNEEKFWLEYNSYHRLFIVSEWHFRSHELEYWNGKYTEEKSYNSAIIKEDSRRDLVDCLCYLLDLAEMDYEISIDYNIDSYIVKVQNPMIMDEFNRLFKMVEDKYK
jgi:hypothetical protein